MNVLFLTASYIPTINGVSLYIKILKKQLEKMGIKVYVLTPSFPGYKDTETNILRYFSLPNPFVKTYPIGIPIMSLDKIKKIKPDIIHTHHPLAIGKFSVYIAEKLNVPLIFTAHTNYHQYLNYYFPKGYQITSKLVTRDLKNIASKCHTVICPSPETEKRLRSLGIKNTKTVFNGIDTEIFCPSKSLYKDRLTIISTGRISKEKNPELLIKIAKNLKPLNNNFKLIIIGEGNLLPFISRQIIRYKLENNILLTGYIKNELLSDIYKTANIFITTSTSEVMPLSILEAEACGLPVIAMKNSNLDSIVNHDKSGLILNQNPKTIARDIYSLWKDKNRLQRYSKKSIEIANWHSSKKNSQEVLNIYRQALK